MLAEPLWAGRGPGGVRCGLFHDGGGDESAWRFLSESQALGVKISLISVKSWSVPQGRAHRGSKTAHGTVPWCHRHCSWHCPLVSQHHSPVLGLRLWPQSIIAGTIRVVPGSWGGKVRELQHFDRSCNPCLDSRESQDRESRESKGELHR